ncbi:MAG: glycosyltransferase [Clostridiales bacterium]|jgi:glycosyltransferase involved in cell wall biosynthesis|nr:glycosyltransferase [Clostridiales bacterium]
MKILLINSVCGVGSTGRICSDIYDVATNTGHICKVAYGRGAAAKIPLSDTYRIGSDADVNIHALMSRITDRAGFYSKRATLKFIDWIKDYNPDVIHMHNIHGYYINIEVLFNYLSNADKKVIWTLHDCWTFTGHCCHFDYVGCNRWKDGCGKCTQKRTYPASYLADSSARNYADKKKLFTSVSAMTLVTPSKWLADLVGQSYLSNYDVKVIYNGIDTDVFKPTSSNFHKRHGLYNTKIVLGVASPWSERKGLGEFVKLSEKLSGDYTIVLVGVTEKQIKTLPKSFVCIKRTDSVIELAQIYSAADVFVNPTFEDNYPTVNVEALSCGTPLVTYSTGGSGECLALTKNSGEIVPKGNVTALVNVVMKNINRKETIKIDNAPFNKKTAYEEYLRAYEQLITK